MGKQRDGLTRDRANAVVKDVQAAVAEVAQKHGLVLADRVGATFNAEELRCRFTLEALGGGDRATAERERFARDAVRVGLRPEDLGREFTFRGESYRVAGLNPKAKSYPVGGARTSDGKRFRFPLSAVVGGEPASGGGARTCQNQHRLNPKTLKLEPCTAAAVTTRKGTRFGDTQQGEPVMVTVWTHLCRDCARGWDEAKAEARAEARMS